MSPAERSHRDAPRWGAEAMDVTTIFARDPRIVRVRVFTGGWVPNSYGYPCLRKATEYIRGDDGTINQHTVVYDAKRSYGRGPRWVAYSERGGRLASD